MRTLRRLASNSLWSLIIQVAPRFADVALFILIGRLDGPYRAGIFSLAIAYVSIVIAAMRGPDDFVTRHVLRAPDDAPAYFSAFFVLRVGIALLAYGALVGIVVVGLEYEPLTAQVILLLSLGLIPENLIGIAQAMLLGQQRFHIPAIVILAVSLGKLGGGAAVLLMGGSLLHVALAWVASSVMGMTVLVGVVWKEIGWAWPLDWHPIRGQARAIGVFLAITVLLALESHVNTIVLSALRGEVDVGLYHAATTVTFSLAMLAQAYQIAVYPLMTRYAMAAPEKLSALYFASLRLLGLFVLPVIALVWWSAPMVIPLIFSAGFQPAVRVLRILIWALLFIFLNAPHARVMLVHDQQDKIVIFVAGSVLANMLLNFALAPAWGAAGTAWARVISSALFFAVSYIFVRRRLIPHSKNKIGLLSILRELKC
ncbi:MAG: flippase [Anaerolineales bacterium]